MALPLSIGSDLGACEFIPSAVRQCSSELMECFVEVCLKYETTKIVRAISCLTFKIGIKNIIKWKQCLNLVPFEAIDDLLCCNKQNVISLSGCYISLVL